VIARIEATMLGLDIRTIVTSLRGTAKYLYETVYCGRGQAENFIKLHKAQLASDRTSCRDPRANQVRLILHTAAYWLLHTLRAATPKRSDWAQAEFNTLRLRLIKIAARVVEGAARIRVWLPTRVQRVNCSNSSPAASPPRRERRGTFARRTRPRNPQPINKLKPRCAPPMRHRSSRPASETNSTFQKSRPPHELDGLAMAK